MATSETHARNGYAHLQAAQSTYAALDVDENVAARQSPRRQSGDLLDLHIDRKAMLEFVREMPVAGSNP
jgi:hypothetical protein